MKLSTKIIMPIAAFALVAAGAATSVALQSHAASPAAASASSASTAVSDSNSAGATKQAGHHGHAPLGGDGNVTAINGSSITMQEEGDENGLSYTIDASNATVSNKGASGSLADIKVGDKIFVQGTTNGTNVTATSISLGHPGMGMDKGTEQPGTENPAQ